MDIKFYGVRGSYPVPGKNTVKYGGNTSCVSIEKEVEGKIVRVIIDTGTGAVQLGKDIISNYFAKKESLIQTILYTHLHPDHTQGFPFFAPNYFKGCVLNVCGMKTLNKHVGLVLKQEMDPPTFPLEFRDLSSKSKIYVLEDSDVLYMSKNKIISKTTPSFDNPIFKIDVMKSYAPSHPQQGSLYFKITDCETNKIVSCIWDIESHAGGDQRVINFVKDSDILIHDTQYTQEEYENNSIVVQGFGHSTYDMAIDNFEKSNSKKLVAFHYNPNHTDLFLDSLEEKYKDKIIFAKEGETIHV